MTWTEKKEILSEVFLSLIGAWKIRHSKSFCINLAQVDQTTILSEEKVNQIVSLVEFIILTTLFWKPGRCFYRSYAMANILRRRGVPIKINLGCENIHENIGKAKAHCWLTLNESLFAEKNNPFDRFPVKIDTNHIDIQYWFSFDNCAKKGEARPK